MRGVLVILAFLVTSPLIARQLPASRTIVGVVRYHGEPVERARVFATWMTPSLASSNPNETGPAITDAKGRFAIPWSDVANARPYILLARDPQGRIGFISVQFLPDLGLPPGCAIELLDVAEAQGRLTNSAGAPLRGLRVQVKSLAAGLDDRAPSTQLPQWLADQYATTTDADGRFRLSGAPAGGRLFATIAAPGFGSPSVNWPQSESCDLRLEKPGSIRVRFLGASEPAKLAGMKLYRYRSQPADQPIKLYDQGEHVVQPTVEQVVTDVIPGRYTARIHSDFKSAYIAQEPAEFVVESGETREVLIPVSPAAEVRGRVIDEKTKSGIAGAGIWVSKPDPRGRASIGWTTTDTDGNYRAFVPPGDLGVSVAGSPSPPNPGYQAPPEKAQTPTAVVAAGATHTFPDLVLSPDIPLEGVVVNAAGTPQPWVTIYAAHNGFERDMPVSDANGHFSIRGLGPKDETALRARTATASTNGALAVDLSEQKGPVKLVVSDANTFRVRGTVTDADGKPLSQATVRIEWRYPGFGRSARYGLSAPIQTMTMNSAGQFESIALWPGDDYRLQVECPGYGKTETALVHGVAGSVHDFGTLKLTLTSAQIRGMIVDARNRPIAGVRVSNNGDGPKPISTVTSDDGRFTLEGLFAGPACVCATKDGYRFTSKLTATSEPSVTITLLAADSSPPASQPDPRPPMYVAAQRNLTMHALEGLWALPDEALAGYRLRVLEGLSRIDLPLAHQWLDERRKRGEPDSADQSALAQVLRTAEAQKLAATDPDEALALIARVTGRDSYRLPAEIARKLAATDPTKAKRFAEEAAVKARALQLPDRAWTMAGAGDLLVDLGQRDAGRKLIFEAADIVDTFGAQGMHGFARGYVAARLAQFDLNRAKILIPSEPQNEMTRWLSNVAVRLAPQDLPRALALLDEIKNNQSSFQGDSRRRIAVALAKSGKPADAIKIAESVAPDAFRPGTALAAVAVEVAKTDPQTARALIDRALSIHTDPTKAPSFSRSQSKELATWTARKALLANHPDMESVVSRVLACRATTAEDSPNNVTIYDSEMALGLALVDPPTAKWVLNRAAPASRPLPSEIADNRNWLFAVALADPERGIAEVDRRIAAVRERRLEMHRTGLIELISILAQATDEERYKNLASFSGFLWPRDDDD
jgi:hypothetical protein